MSTHDCYIPITLGVGGYRNRDHADYHYRRMRYMPKIKMRKHNDSMKIVIERYQTGKHIMSRVSDGWIDVHREGVRVKCMFKGTEYLMDDELFYNKYGNPTGWHPLDYDDFFRPYMGKILNEIFRMRSGDIRFITVEGR